MKTKTLIILIFSLFFTSCIITMSYKSSKLRKIYSKNYRESKKVRKSMKKDFNKREKLYNSLNLKYDNLLFRDYPKLSNILEKMNTVIHKVEKEENNYLIVRNDIYQLTQKRKKIKSNNPEWERYNKIEDRAEKLNNRLKKLVKSYKRLSKKYNKILKEANRKIVKHKKRRK